MRRPPDEITVTETGDTLPVVELLTGRGFITGKSGSGKSNTASVICEELLKADLPFLIVDTDGEYYGLKERYELLHAGADANCDVQVDVRHAGVLVEIALEDELPVILDVSGYLDQQEAQDLIEEVVEELFIRENQLKQPFLLFVEEIHEYLPESGSTDSLGKRLLQVAKRGRKRGLGMCGMSQRPAAVDKNFITQCDWIVWHRLTWNNDTDVVARIIDNDAADTIETLDAGEALMMTDWDEEVNRVRFRKKRTYDAGATPGLGSVEQPDLRTVSIDAIRKVEAVGEASVENAPVRQQSTSEPSAPAAESDDDESFGEETAPEEGDDDDRPVDDTVDDEEVAQAQIAEEVDGEERSDPEADDEAVPAQALDPVEVDDDQLAVIDEEESQPAQPVETAPANGTRSTTGNAAPSAGRTHGTGSSRGPATPAPDPSNNIVVEVGQLLVFVIFQLRGLLAGLVVGAVGAGRRATGYLLRLTAPDPYETSAEERVKWVGLALAVGLLLLVLFGIVEAVL